MTSSELRGVAVAAADACRAAIGHMDDGLRRQSLCDGLAPLVDPSFLDGDARPAVLQGLLRQSCVLADILRDRLVFLSGQRVLQNIDRLGLDRRAAELQGVLDRIIAHLAAACRA
jgi:hypothetical protein